VGRDMHVCNVAMRKNRGLPFQYVCLSVHLLLSTLRRVHDLVTHAIH
jgi:hypothetical protein